MTDSAKSLLDEAYGCALLHRGGEASAYRLSVGSRDLVLKWYADGAKFDALAIETLGHFRVDGLYRILESGNREGTPYIVYEYAEGLPLSAFETLPVAVSLKVLRLVAKTLDGMAKLTVHHGDLNPDNILVGSNEEFIKTTIIDCGIVGPGALAYAAPERFSGAKASVKSDLFSLGLLLFRLIYGKPLVEAGDFDAFASQMSNVDSNRPGELLCGKGLFSPQELTALEPLWKGLLAVDPEDRFEDFDELDEVLEIALDSAGGGEIALQKGLAEWASGELIEKMRQNAPALPESREKGEFPYRLKSHTEKKFPVVPFLVCLIGLILLIVILAFAMATPKVDIDDVGSMVLKKSRSLESVNMDPERATVGDTANRKDVQVDPSLLNDLPIPQAGESQ